MSILNKWVSEGRCDCDTHNDSYFMIEINSDMLSIDVIQVTDALEDLHAEFTNIISRLEKSLQLVVLQRHVENSI